MYSLITSHLHWWNCKIDEIHIINQIIHLDKITHFQSNYCYAIHIFDKVVNIDEILHLDDISPRWNLSPWINIVYWKNPLHCWKKITSIKFFNMMKNKQGYEFLNQNDIFYEFHDLNEVYHVSQLRHYNGIHQPLD